MAKISIDVPVRWSDMDAYGHVNNAAMLTLLEETRIRVFLAQAGDYSLSDGTGLDPAAAIARALADDPGDSGDSGDPDDPGDRTITVIANQQIEYILQVQWTPEPVRIDLWVGSIGGASFDFSYTVTTPAGELAAKASSTVVLVDADTGRPRRLNEAQVEALSLVLEDPVTFRR